MGSDDRKLAPYTGPGASSWVTGADAERERLWSLIETSIHLAEVQARLECSDSGYVSTDTLKLLANDQAKARTELRQALGFAVD